ncbi:type II secretion system F family protein [Planctomicrobium sp. SH527]|uniref:type II secretion system F family protein n=1 Tax=Planctomicrobium sp. SH527 TaxID=3448123 RepID=UPI003F5C90FC
MFQFQLSPQQISILMIGGGVAVTLYLVYKLMQWLFQGRKADSDAPRVKPVAKVKSKAADKSSKPVKGSPETVSPVAAPPAAVTPVAVTPVSGSASAAPVESSSAAPVMVASQATPNGGNQETVSPVGSPQRESGAFTSAWPTEPKFTEKRNLFEDAGVEYPYATGEDYRFGSVTPILSELMPSTEEGRREQTKVLRNAGYFEPHAWQNFSALRYLGLILPILFFGVLLVFVPETWEPIVIGCVVVGPALGWALPALWIRRKAADRLLQIEQAMPDMLDLLNMCVSQGMTVARSLGRISREFLPVYPALSKELQIVVEQARVGTLPHALRNFSDRVDLPEVHSFTSLLAQTEQLGTSVSEALGEYSDGMRENQRQRADEKANAATFKLLFPTVLCLMPAVFLLLMGPAVIELNDFFARGGVGGLNRPANQAIDAQR